MRVRIISDMQEQVRLRDTTTVRGVRRHRTMAVFIKAFRVVDADSGVDVVQPWFTGRTALRDARKVCADYGYEIVEVSK